MKTTNYLLKAAGLLCLLLYSKTGQAQTCTVSFTPAPAYNGVVSFMTNAVGFNTVTVGSSNFAWDFGDGNTASGATLFYTNHTYTATGTYTAVVSYTDATGTCTSSATQTLSVLAFIPSFSFTQGSNGQVTFSNTTVGAPPGTVYSWNFGDSNYSSALSPTHTYSNNGVYYITLTASNPSYNNLTAISNTLSISSITACTAYINFTQGISGNVNFVGSAVNSSTSTPGTFSWDFGDGNTGSGNYANTTYSANGIYTVTLTHVNSVNTCTSIATQTISISNAGVCNLNASFVSNVNYTTHYFSSTSSGVLPGATYTWIYGDGSSNGSGASSTHQYTTPGTYTAMLIVDNNMIPACIDTAVNVVNSCVIQATITATTDAYGTTSFTVNSAQTNSATSYYWNFGDGNQAYSGAQPVHTYTSAGNYSVTVTLTNLMTCTTTIGYALNIGSITPCVASANFSMAPTPTPQVWYVIPPAGSIASATWDWGDGNTSNTLYASHNYASAGTYTICLSVTLTCGNSATSCSSYAIYKTGQDMSIISVIVVDPSVATGLNKTDEERIYFSVSPNPGNGLFNIRVNGLSTKHADIAVYDIVGRQVYAAQGQITNGSLIKTIELDQARDGIYFIKISANNQVFTKKVIVAK